MPPEVPPERILDIFTRTDELLVLNLEATRKLTEAIAGLPAPPTIPLAPPRVVVTPAPAELLPLTTRLDSIGLKLDSLQSSLKEHWKRDLQGRPIAVVNTYSGSDTSYKTVAKWRIGDMWGLGAGVIEEISMATNEYDKTHFRLSVMGKVLFKDLKLNRPLTLRFSPHEVPRGDHITLGCKSTDGTSIKVDGSITGKEF